MKKLLIVSLTLVTLVTACSESEKVYSLKICESKSIESDDCDKCKTSQEVKVKYEVNKSTSSVLQTIIQSDGTSKTSTFDTCKIVDDESFECIYLENMEEFSDNPYLKVTRDVLHLSNNKWEKIYSVNVAYASNNQHVEPIHTYSCGTEIVSISN